MYFDVPTLMLAGAFVACFSGAFLLFAWYQYRETHAALWWAAGDAAMACAIILMAVGSAIAEAQLFTAGLTLLCISAALTWAGARSFDGRKIHVSILVAGTLFWLAFLWLPSLWPDVRISTRIVHALILIAYYGATAYSLFIKRSEAWRARQPLIVLLLIHTFTLVVAIPAALVMSLLPTTAPPVLSWFGIIHFETIVFSIGTAIFLVAMMKERGERRHADASNTDSLTGLLNRRGFLLKAERVLARCRADSLPAAVVVFDLDHFKTINDRFGHAVGDMVLLTYAEVCRKVLRPSDEVGRIGGEEFAAILPGVGIEAAFAMAERIRKSFALTVTNSGDRAVKATLCGGVSSAVSFEDIHDLLKQADVGLYKAKNSGRNRIERAETSASPPTTNVLRIA